ncbi:hypothetical protein RMQ97_14555 [Maricaulis sp. D1M11]|uniref:hypothetical protein n=1 Tax=Maricaulis sp. D1M11 TaxID=3076117 RepID=UPI0039B41F1C
MSNTSPFSADLIRAINQWQRGMEDKAKKLCKLISASSDLPDAFKRVDQPVYRQVRLYAGLSQEFILDEIQQDGSAWTLSRDVAKTFRQSPNDREKIMFLLEKDPSDCEVILNLAAVYADPYFMKEVKRLEAAESVEFKGIRDWKGSQREVVLRPTTISYDEIVAFGAFRCLSDVIPPIGPRDPSAPSDNEIMKDLIGVNENEHFWTDVRNAKGVVSHVLENVRGALASTDE